MWASQTRGSSEAQSEKRKENRRKVVEHLINAGADINKPAGVSTLLVRVISILITFLNKYIEWMDTINASQSRQPS